MSKKQIYLAGAVSGISPNQARGWRDEIAVNLWNVTDHQWRCFDPCDHMSEFGEAISESEALAYDLDHLRHSRLMIVSFEFNPLSVGTNIEMGVAYENRIPIIGYNPGKLELHPWQEAVCTHVCKNLNGLYQFLADHYLNEE